MKHKSGTIEIDAFITRVFEPEGDGPFPVILLNHGWTGDENSMSIFAEKLSPHSLIISPRGLHTSKHPELGGYSWVERPSGKWSWLEDFAPSVGALNKLMDALSIRYPQAVFSKFRIAGFSQGAALSYAYALMNPHRVDKLASLSGFLPTQSEALIATHPLKNIPILIGHGTKDEIVPIEMAYAAEKLLIEAGAIVNMCESDVGHKLGGECFRKFREFMDS